VARQSKHNRNLSVYYIKKSTYGLLCLKRIIIRNFMQIGYARVSTEDQNLALQHDALQAAGCERVFDDTASGAKANRPGLERAVEQLRDGDTLVVWRLDRLGRSLKDLITKAEELKEMGVGLKSLQESIDTTSSGGQLIFHMFGALAEFERNLIRERTQAGLTAARARGRKGGRKKALDRTKRAHAVELYHSRKHTVPEICALMGISRATLYAYVDEFADAK
jgi:DNA invertase Pin-like site-specific DNA recombinase